MTTGVQNLQVLGSAGGRQVCLDYHLRICPLRFQGALKGKKDVGEFWCWLPVLLSASRILIFWSASMSAMLKNTQILFSLRVFVSFILISYSLFFMTTEYLRYNSFSPVVYVSPCIFCVSLFMNVVILVLKYKNKSFPFQVTVVAAPSQSSGQLMQTQLLGLQPGVSVAGQMASSQAGLARSTAILVPVGSAAGQKVFTTQARTDQVYF